MSNKKPTNKKVNMPPRKRARSKSPKSRSKSRSPSPKSKKTKKRDSKEEKKLDKEDDEEKKTTKKRSGPTRAQIVEWLFKVEMPPIGLSKERSLTYIRSDKKIIDSLFPLAGREFDYGFLDDDEEEQYNLLQLLEEAFYMAEKAIVTDQLTENLTVANMTGLLDDIKEPMTLAPILLELMNRLKTKKIIKTTIAPNSLIDLLIKQAIKISILSGLPSCKEIQKIASKHYPGERDMKKIKEIFPAIIDDIQTKYGRFAQIMLQPMQTLILECLLKQ
jgi:hypothetical protein